MAALADRWPGLAAAMASALLGALAGGLLLAESYEIAASAILAAAMGAIAVEDLRRLRVPDAWNAAAAFGGFVVVLLEARWSGAGPLGALGRAALAALFCGGAFYLLREAFFRLRGMEGLGLGDVKLAATGGIWLGWQLFAVAVTLAALAAIVWVAIAIAMHQRWPRERKIPFAAFMAPAVWVCWYFSKTGRL